MNPVAKFAVAVLVDGAGWIQMKTSVIFQDIQLNNVLYYTFV